MQIMDVDEDLSSICDSTVSIGGQRGKFAGKTELCETFARSLPGIFDRGLSPAGANERHRRLAIGRDSQHQGASQLPHLLRALCGL